MEQQTATAVLEALRGIRDALQWASGSPDFSPGGRARRGWLKVGRPALKNIETVILYMQQEVAR